MQVHTTPDRKISIHHADDWSGEVIIYADDREIGAEFRVPRDTRILGADILSGDYDRPNECQLTERELRRATALAMFVRTGNTDPFVTLSEIRSEAKALCRPAGAPVTTSLGRGGRSSVIPGDVIRHTNSGRIGAVLRIKEFSDFDEYIVRAYPMEDNDADEIWWSARHVERVRLKDPYRRYLAMCAAEDDPIRTVRRARARHPRHGASLPEDAWDKAYWRLANLMRKEPDGKYACYDLGRAAWDTAMNDCLARRDRAMRARWAATDRRMAAQMETP